MSKIVSRPLPNSPSPAEFSNAEVKRAVMLLSENIKALKSQLEDAQRAIIELQRRK